MYMAPKGTPSWLSPLPQQVGQRYNPETNLPAAAPLHDLLMKNLQDVFLEFLDQYHDFQCRQWHNSHCSRPDLAVSVDGNNVYCTLTFNASGKYCCWNQSCHIGFRYGEYWEALRELLSHADLHPSQLCLHVKVNVYAGASFAGHSCARTACFGGPFSALKLDYEDTIQEAPSFKEFINSGAIDISDLLRDFFPESPDVDEELHQRHTPHRTTPPHYKVSGAIKGHTLWLRSRLLPTGGFCCPSLICHKNLDDVDDWQYLRELLQSQQIELPRRIKVIWEQITERGAMFYDEPYIASPWCSTETLREWMQMWEEIPGQPEPEGIDISRP